MPQQPTPTTDAYQPVPQQGCRTSRLPRLQVVVTLFAAASLAAVAIGVSVPEDGHSAWHLVKAWGGVALVAAH